MFYVLKFGEIALCSQKLKVQKGLAIHFSNISSL